MSGVFFGVMLSGLVSLLCWGEMLGGSGGGVFCGLMMFFYVFWIFWLGQSIYNLCLNWDHICI